MAGNGIAVQLIDPTTGLPYSAAPGAAAAIPAGTNNIGSTTGFVGYNETAGQVAVAASGSPVLTPRTPPAWATKFNARVYSTQAGTLNIAEALAGGSTVPVASIAVVAGVAQTLSVPLVGTTDSYIAQYVNGTTAGNVSLASSFTAN